MQSRRQRRRKTVAEINVVPYIDVMLVLLIIFMITAPILSQGVQVNLPQAKAQVIPRQEQEPIILTVDAQGNYYLNLSSHPGQPIAVDSLVTFVTDALKNTSRQQRPVFVKGDKNVNYGKVMQAMVLLQQAGAQSVGLITDPSLDS